MRLRYTQNDVSNWANKNFRKKPTFFEKITGKIPVRPAWHPLLGICEECGELAHGYLKMTQGIRGDKEEHIAEIRDAIGDIMIYLCDFCSLMGFDLESILETTWKQVQQRDWKKNKKNGAV